MADSSDHCPDCGSVSHHGCNAWRKVRLPRGIHSWLCTECDHLASDHRWSEKKNGGSLTEGPYVCSECGCSQRQDGPWVPMDRADYERWKAMQ